MEFGEGSGAHQSDNEQADGINVDRDNIVESWWARTTGRFCGGKDLSILELWNIFCGKDRRPSKKITPDDYLKVANILALYFFACGYDTPRKGECQETLHAGADEEVRDYWISVLVPDALNVVYRAPVNPVKAQRGGDDVVQRVVRTAARVRNISYRSAASVSASAPKRHPRKKQKQVAPPESASETETDSDVRETRKKHTPPPTSRKWGRESSSSSSGSHVWEGRERGLISKLREAVLPDLKDYMRIELLPDLKSWMQSLYYGDRRSRSGHSHHSHQPHPSHHPVSSHHSARPSHQTHHPYQSHQPEPSHHSHHPHQSHHSYHPESDHHSAYQSHHSYQWDQFDQNYQYTGHRASSYMPEADRTSVDGGHTRRSLQMQIDPRELIDKESFWRSMVGISTTEYPTVSAFPYEENQGSPLRFKRADKGKQIAEFDNPPRRVKKQSTALRTPYISMMPTPIKAAARNAYINWRKKRPTPFVRTLATNFELDHAFFDRVENMQSAMDATIIDLFCEAMVAKLERGKQLLDGVDAGSTRIVGPSFFLQLEKEWRKNVDQPDSAHWRCENTDVYWWEPYSSMVQMVQGRNVPGARPWWDAKQVIFVCCVNEHWLTVLLDLIEWRVDVYDSVFHRLAPEEANFEEFN
ncbi:hypothetical protein C2S52_017690 [Perilla frutescens var. hirtella]|nr:hypothetical protein C2S52_017690 [Perilla frutescens var. hirtella]